ncbi:MAG: type II toxin-antitoxin system death-on-curing family toxin [Rhodospirillaceae bacterium]|nr:type II toxin-antitoxin system death-on-curing family toxin [Rhodospirillaceae bacterium]MBT7488130.1 type II toxin-antitoxin system death-on-curing family toxin [Rhodospirillales bacterium]MBT5083021.1 type II toxin-antitoxin system death-on-curing family toxin [Rhodospirillaceae bacterium]MBT5524465.1 type II toxin-antitoxin system death-on-curing family toxin [Rhodospirillaceae bacterium]MBT5878739.1 type II toxin-antitoxin system death-on-curing family toxin [Rhodospirillaceae bacterium]
MSRDYLTLADVLAIHGDQIATYGGGIGIRDPGQLEAALFRPQSGYYEDIFAEAAALWESLSQYHPFVDGNKRTAFASMFTFLTINGHDLTANADQSWQFLSGLYESGELNFEALESWLRENVKEI